MSDTQFIEFLKAKKIDADRWKKIRSDEFHSLENAFNEMGPKSFDHSFKFKFNPIRLEFPLKETSPLPDKPKGPGPMKRPVMKKPKTN